MHMLVVAWSILKTHQRIIFPKFFLLIHSKNLPLYATF